MLWRRSKFYGKDIGGYGKNGAFGKKLRPWRKKEKICLASGQVILYIECIDLSIGRQAGRERMVL